MNGKRVLVTGGSGVIAQKLIRLLVDEGAIVRSVDKRPFPSDRVENVESIQLDLAVDDLAPIESFDPDVVFHLAAAFERTDESASFWNDNWQDNMVASHRLIDVLRELNRLETVIFASSYLVYDSRTYLSSTRPDNPTLVNEQTAIDPRNLCGAAKYYTEEELSFLAETKNDFRAIWPRIFRVYGRGSKDVISRWVRAALRNETINVYNEQNMFDFIHADDVAEGLLRLAQADRVRGSVNLGRGVPCRISKVLKILNEEIPGTTDNIVNEGVGDLYEASCADVSRLVESTGWRPTYDLKSGIQDVIEYERSRVNR